MLLLRQAHAVSLRSLAARIATSARSFVSKNSDDASSSDDENEPKKQKASKRVEKKTKSTAPVSPVEEQEESAVARLNRLLSSMQTEDTYSVSKQASATMSRPGEMTKKRKETAKQEAATKDIFAAAQRVASLLGEDDKKKTESELLAKLLGHGQPETVVIKEKDGAKKKTESDLSLSELIVGMKIDRSEQPKEESRSDFVRRSLAAKVAGKYKTEKNGRQRDRKESKREAETYTGSVNLFGCEPLGIFKNPAELKDTPDMLSTWAHLEKRALKLQVTHPPANYFEKIALWTEQGKVWRFPIDNEQDVVGDADVDFSEHVFLEQHLESWCPTKGPIRHFMELVCVGLSKNPYISAKEKKDHIMWYRDYFETKKDMLKDFLNKEKISAGDKQIES